MFSLLSRKRAVIAAPSRPTAGIRELPKFKEIPRPPLTGDFSEYLAEGWIVQQLWLFLARCIHNQLIRNIELFKAENERVRKRVVKRRIHLKPEE